MDAHPPIVFFAGCARITAVVVAVVVAVVLPDLPVDGLERARIFSSGNTAWRLPVPPPTPFPNALLPAAPDAIDSIVLSSTL